MTSCTHDTWRVAQGGLAKGWHICTGCGELLTNAGDTFQRWVGSLPLAHDPYNGPDCACPECKPERQGTYTRCTGNCHGWTDRPDEAGRCGECARMAGQPFLVSADCPACGRRMADGASCDRIAYRRADGATVARPVFTLEGPDATDPCNDCGAPTGGYHHVGCDRDYCEHGQLPWCEQGCTYLLAG